MHYLAKCVKLFFWLALPHEFVMTDSGKSITRVYVDCYNFCSRKELRGRERHTWARREAEWSFWKKRHRR